MSKIFIRDLRAKQFLGDWSLEDGDRSMSGESLHVGDLVNLFLEIPEEIASVLKDAAWDDFRFGAIKQINGGMSVSVPFVVVSRSHFASPYGDVKYSGVVKYLGLSITLEARDWRWEDLWRWIIRGDRPTWADPENLSTLQSRSKY